MWLEEELREAMASSKDAIVCDRAKLTCFLLGGMGGEGAGWFV
jgi:hypothetical protein